MAQTHSSGGNIEALSIGYECEGNGVCQFLWNGYHAMLTTPFNSFYLAISLTLNGSIPYLSTLGI